MTWREWGVVGSSAALAPLVVVAVRCLGLERATRAVHVAARVAGPRAPVPRTPLLVHGVTRRLGCSCLTRALVLHGILTRQGVPSTVVIGASRREEPAWPSGDQGTEACSPRARPLHAHAWVESDAGIVSVDGTGGCVALHRLGTRVMAHGRTA